MQKKAVFNPASPGFLYAVVVTVLGLLAIAGVEFPDTPENIAGEITTLSGVSFYAVLGILATSVIFPIWNAVQKGAFTLKGIFGSTLTWIAIANGVFAASAAFGLVFPDGTGANLVQFVAAKDWGSLFSLLITTIVPTIVRFIKDRN